MNERIYANNLNSIVEFNKNGIEAAKQLADSIIKQLNNNNVEQ